MRMKAYSTDGMMDANYYRRRRSFVNTFVDARCVSVQTANSDKGPRSVSYGTLQKVAGGRCDAYHAAVPYIAGIPGGWLSPGSPKGHVVRLDKAEGVALNGRSVA